MRRAEATVAVIGCGGVGIAAIQGARPSGASVIVGVDTVAAKRRRRPAALRGPAKLYLLKVV